MWEDNPPPPVSWDGGWELLVRKHPSESSQAREREVVGAGRRFHLRAHKPSPPSVYLVPLLSALSLRSDSLA